MIFGLALRDQKRKPVFPMKPPRPQLFQISDRGRPLPRAKQAARAGAMGTDVGGGGGQVEAGRSMVGS